MKFRFLAAAAISAWCGVVLPASASILTVTYTGNFVSGADVTGVFGTANTPLLGDAYTLVFTFDSSAGLVANTAASTSLTGAGSGNAILTIAGLGSLSVGGNSSTLDGNDNPAVYTGSLTNQIAVDVFGCGTGCLRQNTVSGTVDGPSTLIPLSIFTPFSLNSAQLAAAGAGAGVSFMFLVVDTINAMATADIWGDAAVTSLTVTNDSVPNATPLPAALPLFASGLGALGFVGWRRKRKQADTAA